MYSSGMVGVAGGVFAMQLAPRYEMFNGVPGWAIGLGVVLSVYAVTFWRARANTPAA